MADNPCKTCTRVKHPEECMNKMCNYWRKWFICWWDEMRRKFYG